MKLMFKDIKKIFLISYMLTQKVYLMAFVNLNDIYEI